MAETLENENNEASATDGDKKVEWEEFGATYRAVATELVHHSFKTVNSNAAAGGIRLARTAALRLPYVSARTLMGAGMQLELDYIANAGKTAKAVKQMRAAIDGSPLAVTAPAHDVEAARSAIGELTAEGLEVRTGYVDLRLRQVLIPKDGDYVSLTPLTAGAVSSHLFATGTGLVARHNELRKVETRAAEEARIGSRRRTRPGTPPSSAESTGQQTVSVRRRIAQAHLGVGGSNPQNVGALVRSMQRPLYVPGPPGRLGPRHAFRIYHQGIPLPDCRALLKDYRDWRDRHERGGEIDTRLVRREEEVRLVERLGRVVLNEGAEAFEVLLSYREILPKEALLDADNLNGEFALASPHMRPPSMRGLVDPRLRDINWPRAFADHFVRHLLKVRSRGESAPLLVLDARGRAAFQRLLAEALE